MNIGDRVVSNQDTKRMEGTIIAPRESACLTGCSGDCLARTNPDEWTVVRWDNGFTFEEFRPDVTLL
jgi:hypothetical protein